MISPTLSQQPPTFVCAESYAVADEIPLYHSSLLSIEQSFAFIRHDYDKKASISLNGVFTPYATYDSDGVMASGSKDYLAKQAILTIKNSDDSIDSEEYIETDGGIESVFKTQEFDKVRAVALNTQVYFAGNSEDMQTYRVTAPPPTGGPVSASTIELDTPDEPDDYTEFRAGPLDMKWDRVAKMWKAMPEVVIGYVTQSTIQSPDSIGAYEEFTINTSGINFRYDSYTCRNYDRRFSMTGARGTLVLAIAHKTVNWTDGDSNESISNSELDLKRFYLPLYIGCSA